jgi:hypothetical protein
MSDTEDKASQDIREKWKKEAIRELNLAALENRPPNRFAEPLLAMIEAYRQLAHSHGSLRGALTTLRKRKIQ